MCARKIIKQIVEIKICLGDILKLEADIIVLPADPNLHFFEAHTTSAYKINFAHLKKEINSSSQRIFKFTNLSVINQGTTGYSLFCRVPFCTGVLIPR